MQLHEILEKLRENPDFDWEPHITSDDLWDATNSMPEDDPDRLLIERLFH